MPPDSFTNSSEVKTAVHKSWKDSIKGAKYSWEAVAALKVYRCPPHYKKTLTSLKRNTN